MPHLNLERARGGAPERQGRDGAPLHLSTARLDLVAATATMLAADATGRDALAGALGAEVAHGWPPELYDRPALDWSAARLAEDPESVGWQLWYLLLRCDGGAPPVAVGITGFKGRPDRSGTAEIGYSVLAAHQRRGYASEAVAALLGWAFAHPEVTRVIAETYPELLASIRVMEKNGFRFEGAGSEERVIRYTLPRAGG